MTRTKLKHAPLTKQMFIGFYSDMPMVLRDKPCGLSWNEVFNLMEIFNDN